jgi:tetratricopeptide (TPR) repeat protein
MDEETSLQQLVDGLRRDRRRGPYAGHREYVATAWAVDEAAGRLLETGNAAEAARRLRTAVDRVTRALMYLDDSSGSCGDALRALTTRYAQALTAAPPKNPQALANWIAATVFDGPGWPDIPLRDFAPALGERGVRQLTDLVEQRADDPGRAGDWGTAFGVQYLREQLAEISGETDHYVEVLAQSLNGPDQYVKIVRTLRAADRPQDALAWAHRGLAAHPPTPFKPQLTDELVALLTADGQSEQALAVRRDVFARTPLASSFSSLAKTAEQLGHPETITWALDLMRTRLRDHPALVTELITCLRASSLDEEAWKTAVDHLDDLSKYTLQTLVEKRRGTRPADTVVPYRKLVDLYLADNGNKYRYQYAVRHLKTLRDIHRGLGIEPEFALYLEELRAAHRRKTSFLTLLDKAGLGRAHQE